MGSPPVSGYYTWMDASDASTLSLSGSSVNAWNDKSGNSRNMAVDTAAAGGSVTYVTGGRPAIRFALTGTVGRYLENTSTFSVQSGAVVFIVCNPSSTGNNMYGSPAVTFFVNGIYSTDPQQIRFSNDVSMTNDKGTSDMIGTTGAFYANSTRVGQTTAQYAPITVPTGVKIITAVTGGFTTITNTRTSSNQYGRYYSGDVHEILVYPSLTTTQRQQVEAYLATKWALTASMDASNTYVVQPPPACFTDSCNILTPVGYKPVADIKTGDNVITHDGRSVPVKVYKQTLLANEDSAPYHVPKNTYGEGVPKKDMELSPLHGFQIAKGLWQFPLTAAVNHKGVKQFGIGKEVTYYHLETPNYFKDHLVCDGTIVDSFSNRQLDDVKEKVYTFNRSAIAYERLTARPTESKRAKL